MAAEKQSNDRLKLVLCISSLLLIITAWLIYDIKSMRVDYVRHHYLVDSRTGERRKPYDAYNLLKVVKPTREYVESSNAMERLYDLEYNLNFENPFQIDQSYSSQQQLIQSGWPVADQRKCGHQLDWILNKLQRNRHNYTLIKGRLGQELTQLVDSFGKPESGTFSGLVTWLGSYEACKQLELDHGRIKTRYCFARMRPIWWAKNESAPTSTVIRLAACLPESCDSQSFEEHKASLETLIKFDLNEFWRNGLEFESLFCLPDERSPIRKLPTSGWVYLYLVSGWLALVLVGSIAYEHLRHTRDRKPEATSSSKQKLDHNSMVGQREASMAWRLAEALSIRCSFKMFKTNRFRVRYGQGERVRVDLSMLDSIKILMAVCVVLGHSAYLWSMYTRTMNNRISHSISGLGRLALSIGRLVDTFFFFFGLLTAHTMMRKFSPRQLASPLTWLLVNFGVFLRVTPLFMLFFWYNKSVSPYTGSGPWWDYGVHQFSQRGVCQSEAWWRSLPYIGPAELPAPACLLPGWFIVSYVKLSLLMPPLIYALCRLPNNLGRALLVGALCVVSVLQLAIKLSLQTSVKVELVPLLGGFAADLMEKFESMGFMSTLGKLNSVAVGCLAGHALNRYDSGRILEWPRWLTSKFVFGLTLLMHPLIFALPSLAHYLMNLGHLNHHHHQHRHQDHIISLPEFIASNATLILMWPILNAVLVINCTTIYNRTFLVRWLGHSFWRVFNKLGLCLFLVHWEVIFVGLTSFEQAPSHGFITDVMKMWAFGVFFSLIIALLVHILFEAPLVALVQLLFEQLISSKSSPQIETQSTLPSICISPPEDGWSPARAKTDQVTMIEVPYVSQDTKLATSH